MLENLNRFFNAFQSVVGWLCAIVLLIMALNVFFDAFFRYALGVGSIAFQELEWHLFSVIIMLGISYTLHDDGHVRVDFLYDNFSVKAQVWINVIGSVVFIWPLALLVAFGSLGFVAESFTMKEISGDPGGLTHRYLVKALIPTAFFMLVLSSIGFMVKNLMRLAGDEVQS